MSKKNKQKDFGFSGVKTGPCHSGSVYVGSAKVGDKTLNIYGGGLSRAIDFAGMDLAFALTPMTSTPCPISLNAAAAKHPCLASLKFELPVVSIDWPDFGITRIGVNGWRQIVDAIIEFTATSPQNEVNVVFFCQGGHGRTGTALAILSVLLKLAENTDPVLWVREYYCKQAVETDEQLDYVEDITGVKTNATPAKDWYGGSLKPGQSEFVFKGTNKDRGGDLSESARKEIEAYYGDRADDQYV